MPVKPLFTALLTILIASSATFAADRPNAKDLEKINAALPETARPSQTGAQSADFHQGDGVRSLFDSGGAPRHLS